MKTKVLAIDDDPEFAELLKYTLEQQGCEVVTAPNGMDGLHLARTTLPDVILLDVLLPDLDGLSVCQILGTQPSTRNIPVFIVSALNQSWAATRGIKVRFAQFFQKPVDLKRLGESVRAASEKVAEAEADL
jgi:DNA-binding response OmpR family regulator